MVTKVNHIGIVVNSIDSALKVYADALGLELEGVREEPEQAVRVAFLPVGDTEVELLEPTNDTSGVARFLEKRGEGVHHICFEVEDIEAELARLAEKGIRLIDEQPRQNAAGVKVAFIHPKSVHGVLVELCEKP